MALKFRRGTTAQQSGSLAFGEPFVNTTLGTLLVGGPNGDIVLSAGGTGSTGNFGAISGSGLDITGNAKIAGNLTLGGAITIGDASADTINVIASVSSSIIPSVTNAFDLGSEDYFWRDIYVSTGSIKFVGAAGNVVGTLTNIGNGLNLDAGIVTKGDSSFGTSSLAVTSVTGSLRVSGSTSFIGTQNITGSIIPGINDTFDLGSVTKQWRDLYLSSGSLYIDGTQVLSSNATELIFATDTGQSIKFNELGTDNITLQTVDGDIELKSSGGGDVLLDPTTGLISVKGNVSMQDGTAKFLSSGGTNIVFGNDLVITGSITTTGAINGLTLSTGIVSSSAQTIANLPVGTVSGSSQITYANISSIPAGIISGSSQLSGTSITDLTIVNLTTVNQTASVVFSSGSNRFGDFGDDIHDFTGSVKISGSIVTIGASTATSFNGTINATNGVVSGSSQILGGSGLVSGSSQVTLQSTTGFTTYDTALATITGSLISSASAAKTTNDSQDVSITNLNSATASLLIETANLESFSSSALTRLTALEVETANLETFSSSALTRLSNLEGKDISITLTGDVTGTGTITDLANVSFATTIAANSVALGTDTTGNYMSDLTQGTGVTITHTPGEGSNATIAIGQAVATSDNVRFNSLGIGMAATGTAGRIDAANDVVAFSSSDIRFKENIKPIENAIDKIRKISGNTYDWKEENKVEHGYEGNDVGVIAQEIEAVLPQLVQTRESGYKAVKYDKLVALLIEGIKEQQLQIEQLRIDLDNCRNNKGL